MDKDRSINLIKRIKPEITDSRLEELSAKYGLASGEGYSYTLYQLFVELNAGIFTDWKWELEDILEDIKSCVPGFTYEILTDEYDEDSAEWKAEIKIINTDVITVEDEIPNIEILIDAVNPYVSKLCDSQFESMFTGGDDHFYLLVPNNIILSSDEKELLEA